ncbi:anti-sigma factor family protein [Enhygromyxa salina]|uniref:Putative zinc-finger domain-containing protein n=1 Tax=Enhygromyxa salina TaxID=215803 RepID=A0A2S9YND9_9BACT|nr:zf-HC2 domain-containing protein [Enhygromyxa salina]PRQ06604.1 hypothetical protein ENSA7_37070 [Enhygromyxa salina]
MSEEDHCRAGRHGHRHDISCREVSEFLLAYLDRELDEPARTEFERHLQLCPPCVHYLDGYRDTIALVRACTRADAAPAEPSCESQRPKKAPPEGLIQAILSAKCRAAKRDPSE